MATMNELLSSGQRVTPCDSRITVPGEGPQNAAILILGEAPGKRELSEGRPFVGPSGELLNDILYRAGFKREEIRIENVFNRFVSKRKDARGKQIYYIDGEKVFHPDQGFSELGKTYKDKIARYVADMPNLKLVIPMGECALQAISDYQGIGKYMCSILKTVVPELYMIPTYHPAACLWGSAYNKIYIDIALGRAKEIWKDPASFIPNPKITFVRDTEHIKEIANKIRKAGRTGFDIEVLRNRLSHISLAYSYDEAFVIPFLHESKNHYSDLEEAEILMICKSLLEDSEIEVIGQNLNFDNSFILEHYGIVVNNFIDTMVAQKTFLPELQMGLANVARLYTHHPYYKDDGQWDKKGLPRDFDLFGKYSGRDAIIPLEGWDTLKEELKDTKNYQTFENQNSLIPIISYMGMKGMRTDIEALDQLAKEADKTLEKWENQIAEIAGWDVNPNSNPELQRLFYGKKEEGGCNSRPITKKKKITTDKDARKKLKQRGGKVAKLARLIDKHKKLAKLNGTYYKVELTKMKDGSYRYLSSYSPVTSMGRLSGKKRLDGAGGNPQNIPKAVNVCFFADPGTLIFNVDLSQADARSVALVGNVKKMLEAFDKGLDLHSVTGSMIFDMEYEQVKEYDKLYSQTRNPMYLCDLGDGSKTHRQRAKQAGHSLNFDLSSKSFAQHYELAQKDADMIVSGYHNQAFPEIREGYHKTCIELLQTEGCTYNSFGRRMYWFDQGDDLRKKAFASIAQSNTVDIINQWGLIPFFYEERFRYVDLIRQVHDSINFQLPIDMGIQNMYKCLLEMRKSLERDLKWKDRSIVIPSDWSVGLDLYNQIDLDLNKPQQTMEALAKLARQHYESNLQNIENAFEEDVENFNMYK